MGHDGDVQTIHRDDVLHVGSIGPLFFQRWFAPGQPAHVERMLEAHRAFVARFPHRETVALSHIQSHAFRPPDEGSRRPIREHTKLLGSDVRAVATVIEADGFVASMVRSVVSGLVLIADRRLAHSVFATVDEGLAYVARYAPVGSVARDAKLLTEKYRDACRTY